MYASYFNPLLIWTQPEESKKRFTGVCETFLDANRIETCAADRAKQSWNDLFTSADFRARAKEHSNLPNSSPDKRLDIFYRNVLADKAECTDLLDVCQMVLVLSHGNAEAERGFSVNKHILQDNMKERSMVAQRVVHQAIFKAGKFTNINIDKQMLGDVRQASLRRKQYLESQKQLKTEEERLAEAKKRKASALKELQAKKKRLEEETVEAKRSIDEEIAQLRRL